MKPNRLARLFAACRRLPKSWQLPAMNFLFGTAVKFYRTAGVRLTAVDKAQIAMVLDNRRKVQNHIKGVHATAMALLVESATGLVVGLNLPHNKLPLLKSLHIDYIKRADGALTAVAALDVEQIASLNRDAKGEISVAVRVTDSAGNEPLQAQLIWAWREKK